MRPYRSVNLFLAATAALAVTAALGGVSASAASNPKAAISIQPASGPLTVEFVAQAAGFSSSPTSYSWVFGDGRSAQTTMPHRIHTYGAPGTYSVSVTETNATSQTATASGRLLLAPCPVGVGQCQAALQSPTGVSSIQASGPIGPSSGAEVDLFSGSFRFPNCDLAVTPAGSMKDSGFTGALTVVYSYNTTNPNRINRTCFASTTPFIDSAGKSVLSGPLASCQTSGPPCVNSTQVSGTRVTKTLSVPPGDPKFGS
jgi:hypothetical protein